MLTLNSLLPVLMFILVPIPSIKSCDIRTNSLAPIFCLEPTSGNASGALIFLHGTGQSGLTFMLYIQLLMGNNARLPHIRIIFPSAPLRAFSPFFGLRLRTWYDISAFSMNATENNQQIGLIAEKLNDIVSDQMQKGIPSERIAYAGFSRGGGMSLHLGYSHLYNKFQRVLAGISALSSFLPYSSQVYEDLRENKYSGKLPLLLQQHGENDHLVNFSMAKMTFQKLRNEGVQGEFVHNSNSGHMINRKQVELVYEFVNKVVPEI